MYEEEKFPQIFLPGGIWGSSCIFPLFAKKNNTQITTYDAGESRLVLSVFGVAAQLQDIPYSFNKILKNPKEKKFAIEKGFTQLEKRRTGNDMISYFQDATNTSQFGNDYYLMLLNSVWDSATLGLHTVYKSMNEWMLDSIEWVLKNTEKKIIIRQHPAERVKDLNNTDLYKEQIEKRFGINKRVIFIEAKKDINTYNLIENALCVLGFSSTIIVESVALGKASIIVSRTYYADFGIVYNAKDKREYYMYLTKASISDLLITQEMKDRACISNYITQSCNWYKTEFTPVRNNFLKWSKLNLQDLGDELQKATLESIGDQGDATDALTFKQKLFNLEVFKNPYTAIAAALLIVVGLLAKAFTHVRDVAGELGVSMKQAAGLQMELGKANAQLIGTGKSAKDISGELLDTFGTLDSINAKNIADIGRLSAGFGVATKDVIGLQKALTDTLDKMGAKLTIKKNLQMPDGIKRKLLNINLAKSEGWKAKTKLDEGLKITIKDFIKS